MSTLTRGEIRARLAREKDPLVITPILAQRQLGATSVDLRLGNQFLVFRVHRAASLNPFEPQANQMLERQVMRFGGEGFVLHPSILALGCSLEYLKIPCDLEGQVEGRSSWARLGLQVATASSVEPGFAGVVTLELSNVGTLPIHLFPGVRIAQLVLRTTSSPVNQPYGADRKYRFPVGPQFSRLRLDVDAAAFVGSPQKD